MSDLVACKHVERVWLHMTSNGLIETKCHKTAAIQFGLESRVHYGLQMDEVANEDIMHHSDYSFTCNPIKCPYKAYRLLSSVPAEVQHKTL